MKKLRIILIAVLVLYGLSSLTGTILSLFNPSKHAELMQLGDMTPGIEKLMLLSGAMLLGQTWLYFSATMLLLRNMNEGYMYAVTLGFIEFFQSIAIIVSFATHGFGNTTDYFALIKGLVLLILALVAFKKNQALLTNQNSAG